MEKILTLAFITASECYRRKVLLILVVLVLLQLLYLGFVGGYMKTIMPEFLETDVLEDAAYNVVGVVFRGQEMAGVLILSMLVASLVPADRRRGLLDFYLAQPLSRFDYVLGKLLGAGIVVAIYFVLTQGVLLYFANRVANSTHPAHWQAMWLVAFRYLVVCGSALVLSLRLRPVWAVIGANLLFNLPAWTHMQLVHDMRPSPPLRTVQWFLPAFEYYQAGASLLSYKVLVPGQFWSLVAYGVSSVALMLWLGVWLLERTEYPAGGEE